ncbi:MAG: D-2-hydroxyacid dehydrogenase [Hespellia sp.]|nr:D-2-hydroxyacid dehydrogenase [Hespellia sp.]
MKIVFLDGKTIGDDIDLSQYEKLGEVVKYDYSSAEEVPARVADADVVILNKVEANAQTLAGAKNLKLICVTATGTNNLDKEYLDSQNIAWRNVAGYSTESVAQHTFAMHFFLAEKLRYYDDYVKSGSYMGDTSFTHFEQHFNETAGQTWGIIGLGAIGRRVADIAACFGAKVIYYSPSGSAPQDGYRQVDFDTLLRTSDIISVHAPLTKHTQKLMNQDAFEKMKSSAIFLNLGRGPIVDEAALTRALENHSIAAAGLDVLDTEPMAADNPLAQISDSQKLLITPHIGWASVQARTNLMNIIYGQIKEYLHL